jgi:hypothetical protein
MKIWTVFVTSLLDKHGTVLALAHYDNCESAVAHRDNINETIEEKNPLEIRQAFVRDTDVRSNFGDTNQAS